MHTMRIVCRDVWVCSLMTKLIPNSHLRHGYSVDPFVTANEPESPVFLERGGMTLPCLRLGHRARCSIHSQPPSALLPISRSSLGDMTLRESSTGIDTRSIV